MLGGSSFTLFHVRGIRIAVDWSWFLILFLLIVSMSSVYGDILGESSSSAKSFGLAILSAIGFFGSILLHELGHAFVGAPPWRRHLQHPALDASAASPAWTAKPTAPRPSSRSPSPARW